MLTGTLAPRSLAAILLSLGTAQGNDPAGTIVRTCAPWDGAAMAFYLTAEPPAGAFPDPPFRSIVVYRELSAALGHAFTVTPLSTRDGIAQECTRAGECTAARKAVVTFGTRAADGTALVSYEIDFGPGRVVKGRVRARVRDDRVMCG